MRNASDNVTPAPSAKAVAAREVAKTAFLIARVETESDLDALREIGRSPSSAKRWDREDDNFKLLHKAAVEAAIGRREMQVEIAISPTDPDDLVGQLNLASTDAMTRLREIVAIKITPYTKAADVAQIRLASEKILEANGILKPKIAIGNQVNILVGDYAREGRKFSPAYRNRTPVDVEGSVS